MNELLKIDTRENKETVNARDLHIFLESKRQFSNWIKERISSHEFIQEVDFTINKFVNTSTTAINVKHDYYISISMAKELCMLENNAKGKEARKYFIACEEKLKELQPKLPQSKIELIEAWLESEKDKERLQIENKEDEPKIDFYEKTSNTNTLFTMSHVAKLVGWGRNRMMKDLRETGIFLKTTWNKNSPSQRFLDNGYFVEKTKIVIRNGISFNTRTSFATGKGLQWLQKKYSKIIF